MTNTKKTDRFRRIIKILYWVLLFITFVYFGFRWNYLVVYDDGTPVNTSFDLQDDFYRNYDIFKNAAELLWNNPSIFRTESGGHRALLFLQRETFSEVYSGYGLDKIISQEEWNVIEQLNKVKKIAYIAFVDGDIPYIHFSFTIINKGRKGVFRLYWFNVTTTENKIPCHEETYYISQIISKSINGENAAIMPTDKLGWFYEMHWSIP